MADMRTVSPYWSPQQQPPQQQMPFMNQYNPQFPGSPHSVPKPNQTDSIGSSPRRSPLPFVPQSASPSPQSFTNPVTCSDNSQQSNPLPQMMNLTGAEQQYPNVPQFVGFMPARNFQQYNHQLTPVQPLPRVPVVANVTPPDDDYFPLVIQDQESTDCDVEKRDFDCSHGPTTVIPLITELGIKDNNAEEEDEKE